MADGEERFYDRAPIVTYNAYNAYFGFEPGWFGDRFYYAGFTNIFWSYCTGKTREMKNANLLFTTSWDDGHPLDGRIADLLSKYGFRGTFYIPSRNVEGRKVVTKSQVREIGSAFEIGGHTLDHVRLDSVDLNEAERQVVEGKKRLEDDLGHGVEGFCYPGGNYNKSVIQIVAGAGFNYARTTANFHLNTFSDPFLTPTTIQLYPHTKKVYLTNFIRRRFWGERKSLFTIALKNNNLLDRLKAMLIEAVLVGGVFHLWGHSWEIEELGAWRLLEDFFRFASRQVEKITRLDNASVFHEVYGKPPRI